MPMSGSRYGSPSDYYSESESTKTRSRIGRLTPASTSSRPSSRPTSRHGSDLAFNLDPSSSRSTDNLRWAVASCLLSIWTKIAAPFVVAGTAETKIVRIFAMNRSHVTHNHSTYHIYTETCIQKHNEQSQNNIDCRQITTIRIFPLPPFFKSLPLNKQI